MKRRARDATLLGASKSAARCTNAVLGASKHFEAMLRRASYDVAIIGGGVVGLGVARAVALDGLRCCVLEASDALCASAASGGNTGIACTAADCDEGTVEHACLERAAELNRDAYDACNVPYAATGAVYVAYGPQEHAALDKLADAHGAHAADVLSSGAAVEARCRLPGLAARGATRGLHVRREITVDPWCVPVCVRRGSQTVRGVASMA